MHSLDYTLAWKLVKTSTEQDYRARIVRTLVYIEQHLDEDLDLEKLSAVAAFSRFHFHRIFRGVVGETVKEHLKRLRLERAARTLKQSGEPIVQVALEAGFAAHESFTRAFGNMFGESPSEYRGTGSQASVYDNIPPVEVKELPPMRLIFLRHVGPYGAVGATWGRLMSWAGMRGFFPRARRGLQGWVSAHGRREFFENHPWPSCSRP